MGAGTSGDITVLLQAWSQGDQGALESLIPLVDQELRRAASRYLQRKRPDPILETTEVVNEVYIRLIGARQTSWQDRTHFFAVCAQIMRRLLVDHARARQTAKRGAGRQPISLDEGLVVAPARAADLADLVTIDNALNVLAKIDWRKGRVVELRFFGGLNVEETAEVLKVSPETVQRDWRLAKAWLIRELNMAEAL